MKPRFIFVDDEPLMVRAMERLVKNEPFDFYWFNSPVKALGRIEEIAPQVILSDQRMPDMHGIQFLKKVREKLPNTARMILTGYCMPDYADSALEKGDVLKFISKPWDNMTLIQEIRNAFRYTDSTTVSGIVWCDICGTKCSANTIQIHRSYHLCTRCKKRAERLPDDALRIVADFLSADVSRADR